MKPFEPKTFSNERLVKQIFFFSFFNLFFNRNIKLIINIFITNHCVYSFTITLQIFFCILFSLESQIKNPTLIEKFLNKFCVSNIGI